MLRAGSPSIEVYEVDSPPVPTVEVRSTSFKDDTSTPSRDLIYVCFSDLTTQVYSYTQTDNPSLVSVTVTPFVFYLYADTVNACT